MSKNYEIKKSKTITLTNEEKKRKYLQKIPCKHYRKKNVIRFALWTSTRLFDVNLIEIYLPRIASELYATIRKFRK